MSTNKNLSNLFLNAEYQRDHDTVRLKFAIQKAEQVLRGVASNRRPRSFYREGYSLGGTLLLAKNIICKNFFIF